MLWITDPIGVTNGSQCHLPVIPAAIPSLPTVQPTLTEHDVTQWNADNGRWTLNPDRFAGAAVQDLQDHCFVLAIDGKLIRSGVVLSSHTARLTGFPTLSVYSKNNALNLQLTSGNLGGHSRLIHIDSLDAVLGQRANLAWQLQRITSKDDPIVGIEVAAEWTAAVQQLIDRNKIRQGVPVADVIKHLGPPTRVTEREERKHDVWIFPTLRRAVDPEFEVISEGGIVSLFLLRR